MSEYSIGKLVGSLVGFVIGIVLVLIVSKFANKNRKVKTEYDERQKVLRGEGYKYGFYAMAIYAALNTILGIADCALPVEPSVYNFTYIDNVDKSYENLIYTRYKDSKNSTDCFNAI